MNGAQPIRALLIDAGCGWVRRLEPALQAAGVQTFLVTECADLLIEARQGNFDIVLVTGALRDVDQTDLPTIIRTVNRADFLPIVWMTDRDSTTAATTTTAALELGIDLVLSRDAALSILLSYMTALVRGKRRTDELSRSVDQLRRALVEERDYIDQLRDDNEQLRELSVRDPLTKLHNARYMHQWLSQAFSYAVRHGTALSVMVFDIDHFKWINDCFGHLAGDKTLKNLARVLRNSVRDSDLVARYGGDEFLIAMPDMPADDLSILAERTLADLRQIPLAPSDTTRVLTCSIGSATYPSDTSADTYQNLVMLADQALYAAKRSGRAKLARWHELSDLHHQAVGARHGVALAGQRS